MKAVLNTIPRDILDVCILRGVFNAYIVRDRVALKVYLYSEGSKVYILRSVLNVYVQSAAINVYMLEAALDINILRAVLVLNAS